jgi:transposase-like protein
MTHHNHPDLLNTVLQLLTTQGTSSLAEGLRLLLDEAMRLERSAVLKTEPYQRCEERLGRANGFKPKSLATRVGQIELRIPQVRDGIDFYPNALQKGMRSEQALMLAMAEMYVQGVSARKVSKIIEELCGHQVSSSQVSTCTAKLDVELQLWRERPLVNFPYLIFDARYEKVRHAGLLVDCAMLIAMGIGADGKRTILGVSVALSEAEVHWRDFFSSLVARGLHGSTFLVSDTHPGMAAARQAVFPSVPWQRCQFHLQQNAQAYVPRLDMRTSNAIYRVNQELKRRTRVASPFANEASLLRLASALLCELSNFWLTGKIHLNMNRTDLAHA